MMLKDISFVAIDHGVRCSFTCNSPLSRMAIMVTLFQTLSDGLVQALILEVADGALLAGTHIWTCNEP